MNDTAAAPVLQPMMRYTAVRERFFAAVVAVARRQRHLADRPHEWKCGRKSAFPTTACQCINAGMNSAHALRLRLARRRRLTTSRMTFVPDYRFRPWIRANVARTIGPSSARRPLIPARSRPFRPRGDCYGRLRRNIMLDECNMRHVVCETMVGSGIAPRLGYRDRRGH